MNWGGGWSDTPPYCNEKGGTVLNAAILLNGEKPVEVTLERIPEQKVVFDSRDMDVHGEFDTIEPLQATGDPYDPFALQKACLLACGIIPREGHTLGEILERLGSGFVMHSEVTNVPKGSGLGTSSILSAACVKAVFEFMGIAYTEEDLYAHVLAMEQIMSTGGGWQDQVGGITSGLKYITSMPGLQQRLQVAHIELSPQTKKELDERFVLIYTGQRRLARNLLRDVVGRYVGNEPDSLFALEEIQKTAVLIDCCTIILIPVSLKCGDTGVIYRLSFLSIRQRLSRWRLIRSRNTIVERTEEIPSATGSAKKAAFAPKKEGRTAALITKRDFLVTESAPGRGLPGAGAARPAAAGAAAAGAPGEEDSIYGAAAGRKPQAVPDGAEQCRAGAGPGYQPHRQGDSGADRAGAAAGTAKPAGSYRGVRYFQYWRADHCGRDDGIPPGKTRKKAV